MLKTTHDKLATGGTISIIVFHSGEDRIVKHFFPTKSTQKEIPSQAKTQYRNTGNNHKKTDYSSEEGGRIKSPCQSADFYESPSKNNVCKNASQKISKKHFLDTKKLESISISHFIEPIFSHFVWLLSSVYSMSGCSTQVRIVGIEGLPV